MLAGQRIGGRYQILHQIGGGGMSVVYLAHDVILNRDVAIKILRYDFANEEELHKRFQREALSATSLAHPNIVSVYDVGEDGEMHYIVMEYIKGKTLKKYIQEYAPLSPARAVHIMKQLTSAIAHAHENGIVHRDIKPQNIMVDENGDVKVMDFGIATSLNATTLTQTNSVLGTVHYLSPEQARGGIATTKSDIYSLGIVLYELLTGELPFSGESAVSIALKHLQSETPSVRAFDATIPQSLENVVLKATAKDTMHRYRNAEEMEEDLMTVLSPARMSEPKFVPPYDDDATKAMPIIKDKLPVEEMVKTRVIPTPETKSEPVVAAPKEPVAEPVKEMMKKPKKKKKWPIFIGLVFLIAVVGIIAFAALTPTKIAIPDVSGLTVEEATEELESLGFVVGDVKEVHSDTVEKDLVTETSPRAGLERKKGVKITLMVSLGSETSEMPNYVGQSSEQAIRLIEQAAFVDYEIEEQFSDEEEGTVIGQTPEAGSDIIEDETTVKLIVSKGKEQVKVQLQNLIGWNESALNEYAKSVKIRIKVSKEASDAVPAGQVISQSPQAGTTVNEGSTVNVVVSSGPAAKLEKTFVETVTIKYEPTEEGLPQTVRVYIQDKEHSMADVYDEFEITEDMDYRVMLKIPEGERGAYRIDRDLSVIEQRTINYDDLSKE